jgi:Pyruvate/2-oxoacid:ferredoxin oxidoreductase delta subunit
MGHLALKEHYRKLRRRLDGWVVGAPESQTLYEILSLLFTPEEAAIAARMPFSFSSTGRVARLTGIAAAELEPKLEAMALKGLLFDLHRNGKSYWFLNPLIVGFFEFTMMRVRPELDQKLVAHKIWEYMFEDPQMAFLNELTRGETSMFRPLPHEAPLEEAVVEILDYDRATHVVKEASAWTVGLCHCRHVKEHLGHRCKYPLELCLSLGSAGSTLARRGIGRSITREECLDVLARSKELGLVQMGDNVRKRALFICNCCSCCCEVLESCRRVRRAPPLVTSNFIADVKPDFCTSCGLCAKMCPVGACTMVPGADGEKKLAFEPSFCLGCGVCAAKCAKKAIVMMARPQRVFTPEHTMERIVRMAVERGKLQNLLFDEPEKLTHDVLRSFTGALLRLSPTRRLLANEQIKSSFVRHFLKLAHYKPAPEL